MKSSLRTLIALAALLCAPLSFAEGFKPARTVDLVVHTGPGGGSDVLARAIAIMVEKEKLPPGLLIRSEEHTSELQSQSNLVCRIIDRKSTRLNSSHSQISYAVFCLKKKKV